MENNQNIKNSIEDESNKEKFNNSSVETENKHNSTSNTNPKKTLSKIINIVGWIISLCNMLIAIRVVSTIRYGNIPTLILGIIAAIIANPLLYKTTKLDKKWYKVCIGYILSIIIGFTSFSLMYTAPWNFDLNRKLEYGNVSFYISNDWDVVDHNDEKSTIETHYIYPFNNDHSTLIMFQVTEVEGSTNESNTSIINSYIDGLKSSGAVINDVTNSNINGYNCVIINWYDEGNRVTYVIPVNNKIYSISYGTKGKISNGFKSKTEEIIKTLEIKNISLENLEKKIEKGKEYEIKVKFYPSNFNENYILKSSDESIAKIENNIIKTLNNGKVTISVESESGLNYFKEIEIYTNVDSVSLDKTELTMHVGDSTTINSVVSPEDASDNKIVWISSYPGVADVDQSGNLIAKSIGTSTIKAIVGGKTAECNVNVVDLTPEEYKAQCKKYSFEELARNPSSMQGKYVKLTGEVVQVVRGYAGSIGLRVNITKWGNYSTYYKDTVYVNYILPSGEDNILEDDIITIYGKASGEKSYTSTLGATITLPEIDAKYIDRN